jgi:hypothetical protein
MLIGYKLFKEGHLMQHIKTISRMCIIVLFLSIATTLPGVAFGDGLNRIYPTNEVSIYRGDQKVGTYTREAPLPEGVTVSANGRCAIKLDDLYLVAEDQSVLSTHTIGRQRNLFLREGIIYFKTSMLRQPLNLITPGGQITVQRILLDASFNDQAIVGYVTVEKRQGEVGVVQGGTLDVLTENGQKTIRPGETIILAQADMDIGAPESETPESDKPAAEQPPEPKEGMSTAMKGLIGGGVAVLALGAIAALGGGGGGGGGGTSVSPSSP